MPELPEVETTRRGIEPYLKERVVSAVVVRERRLRWPVPPGFEDELVGDTIRKVGRRAKYLLLELGAGTLMIHLGMSGSLRILTVPTPPSRHDHVDLCLDNGAALRFRDARRFGSLHWLPNTGPTHPLLRNLGPEPLSPTFTGNYLYARSRARRVAVKPFIMNQAIVVGVGNIYAAEALHRARIHPGRPAGRISIPRYATLATAIKTILQEAIGQGGTTLRDFVAENGQPGYFKQQLRVYGRLGQACSNCGEPLRSLRLGQRGTVYCAVCQR